MEKEIIAHPIVAGAVIKQDGKYLLIQEAKAGARGQWNWPAGRVEIGDTIEQTAVKEAKEETGFDVELVRKIDIYQFDETEPPQHAFTAKIIGGTLCFPEDEIMDARWLTIEEIKKIDPKLLRGSWILSAMENVEING